MDRENIVLGMVIAVAVCQVISMAVLIVLCKVLSNLRKDVEKYKDSLPLVRISTCTTTPTTPTPTLTTPTTSTTAPSRDKQYSIVGTKQKAEVDEIITIMPTPSPDRRSGLQDKQLSTVAMTTTRTESTSEIHPGLSFTSFNAEPRDSGIVTVSVRDHGSTSSSTRSESPKEANRWSRDSHGSSVFAETEMFSQEERTASNGSRDSKAEQRSHDSKAEQRSRDSKAEQRSRDSKAEQRSRVSPRDHTKSMTSHGDIRDEERRKSRLLTMPIEQIDCTGNEKRYKRVSKLLNRMSQEIEESETNQEMSFVNVGYYGDDKTKAPLASQESICSLSSEIVDENGNGVMGEVYVNQEIIDQQH